MEQWNDSNDHTEFQSSSYGATSCSYSNDDSSSSLFNGGYNDYRSPNVLDASFETKYEDFTMHDPTDESSRYSQTASPFNCASTVPISELEFGDLSLEGSTNLGATSPYLDESSTSSFDKEVGEQNILKHRILINTGFTKHEYKEFITEITLTL